MSGVGEALAIVSCVATLIQAYDSGSRIVQQIKGRRQAHGALPPSYRLEKSFEQGKREIQAVVFEGNERFGSDFEAGDTTAKLALLHILAHTQNIFLERLTVARADDRVIDFEECVNFSDKGRNDAVLALRQLFQRMLEEDMTRKGAAAVKKEDAQKETPIIQPVLPAQEEQPTANSTVAEHTDPASPPETERKKPRGFFERLRRTLSGNDAQLPTPPSTPEPAGTIVDNSSQLPISRASTLSTMSDIAPITKYGGFCKYAHQMRETGPSDGLMRQTHGGYYNPQVVYACQSKKCEFRIKAEETKKGYQLDETVYGRHGLQFRWIFLAKSHVAHRQVSDKPPFLCLICVMLKNISKTYHGHDELFLHIVRHQERTLGETLLEGPLVFRNGGVIVDPKFDINLPEVESPPLTPKSEHGMPIVGDAELHELRKSDDQRKGSSLSSDSTETTSSQNDPYENPWNAPTWLEGVY